MNLMKNVMGVVAKGNSKNIYFCKYSYSDYEQYKIKKMLESIAFRHRLRGNDVRILAIESGDEMRKEMKLVGITYRVEDEDRHYHYKTAILEDYKDLSVCFEDMNEML